MMQQTSAAWQQLLQYGEQSYQAGDIAEAQRALELALSNAHTANAPEAAVAEIFFNLGLCHEHNGDLVNAQSRYKQALGTAERSLTPDSLALRTIRERLIVVYEQTGQLDRANDLRLSSASGQSSYSRQQSVDNTNIVMARVPESQSEGTVSIQPGSVQPRLKSNNVQNEFSNPPSTDDLGFNSATMSSTRRPLPSGDPMYSESAVQPDSTMGNVRPDRKATEPAGSRAEVSSASDYDKRLASVAPLSPNAHINVDQWVHPREKSYGRLCTFISCLGYFGLVLSLIGIPLIGFGYLITYLISCVHHGQLRSYGIRISPEQFPEVYEAAEEICTAMSMPVPEMFIVQEHGLLNAYAKRAHHRDVVVIYSDVFEMAYKRGMRELKFILAHELTHVKRGHVKFAWLRTPAHLVPFLGNAYSRACEYTCDRVAAKVVPDGALYGLVALSSGTKLYHNVNLKALYEQQSKDWDFWTWYAEVLSTHPNLVNRITAIGLQSEISSRDSDHSDYESGSSFPRRRRK